MGGDIAGRVLNLHIPALTDGRPRTVGNSSILPWREVKRRLGGRTGRELLTIISGCYRQGEDVRKFLTFKVLETDDEVAAAVDDLRRLMGQTFWARARGGRPPGPDLRAARGLLSDIRGPTRDPRVLLDAMLDYVEHGIDLTREHGDVWEGYYSSVEGVFDGAAKHILANTASVDVAAAVARIEAMVGMHLHLAASRQGMRVFYSLQGGEIDSVVKGEGTLLVEVKYKNRIGSDDLSRVWKAMDATGTRTAYLVSKRDYAVHRDGDREVMVIPAAVFCRWVDGYLSPDGTSGR